MSRRSTRVLIPAVASVFLLSLSVAVADTLTVTNTNASGPGSLAQAITDANARTGQDSIVFNIPGSGVHVIQLSSAPLPEITDSVIIDGYTQPGAHPNTLDVGDDAAILIQLDGGLLPNGNSGLSVSAPNCVVRGLAITGFSAKPDPYGYDAPSGGCGIYVHGSGAGGVVQGNFLGIAPDGRTARRNYKGIRVDGAPTTVGGSGAAERNVISGNDSGVALYGSGAGIVVAGNYIGTDASGTVAVGNREGIESGARDVLIGGTEVGSGNLISGNQTAIELGTEVAYHIVAYADRDTVAGNLIGTQADGVSALGNWEAISSLSSDCMIGGIETDAGNVIAFNGRGVTIYGSSSILSNSIYSNNGRGITLGNPSANNVQAPPEISSETVSKGDVTVTGSVHSTANTQVLIQVFADSQSLTSSRQSYIGSTTVTTDSNGNATFAATLPVSDTDVVFNATATDAAGNTSEFSRNVAYLMNLSARAAVGTGENALIGGVIMQPGQIVARGIGPSLTAVGIKNALLDPTLEIHDQSGATIFDDNWKDDQSQAAQIQQTGLAPARDAEAAIMPFAPSSPIHWGVGFTPYTAIVRGKNDTVGVGLVELYAVPYSGVPDYAKLANLSARGYVGTGDDVIIGGFIVGGGTENPRICVRAIGASLKAAGVTNPLSDPTLELHDSNGALIATNDDWWATQGDELQTVGLAPTENHESAILRRLGSGAYTAVVRGKGNTTGVGLVEIYNLQ